MAQKEEVPHPERDDAIVYVFTYLLIWISGILIFLTLGQENKRMKFHSIQAILLGIIVTVVAWVPLPFFYLIALLLWVYGLYIGITAYGGRDISIPVIGDYAMRMSK